MDQGSINEQRKLLDTHRDILAILLQQLAIFGIAYAPPTVIYSIKGACEGIARCKATLRNWGVAVEDHPDDEILSSLPSLSSIERFSPLGSLGVLHQLRAPTGDFVGREREIDDLLRSLRRARHDSKAASVCCIRGMGGIGKTELAYVVARDLSEDFPDAQIVLNLQGSSEHPATPIQLLRKVILDLDRHATLPSEPNDLLSLYRSLLHGKHVLILADDVESAQQVRPLLPPVGCALLITSRNRFWLPNMTVYDLEVLTEAESVTLLKSIYADIDLASKRLAKLCGYLPLALRVSASYLQDSLYSIEQYLERLESKRLCYLNDLENPDDPEASVEASLALSYDALEPAMQQTLGHLTVFPAHFDLTAASAVAQPDGEDEETITRLFRRSLLQQAVKHYRLLDEEKQIKQCYLHDLVRAFAEKHHKNVGEARNRYIRYYAALAQRASLLLKKPDQTYYEGLELFNLDWINIEAGLTWAGEQAETTDLLLTYATATLDVFDRFCEREKRVQLLEKMPEIAREAELPALQARLLIKFGDSVVQFVNRTTPSQQVERVRKWYDDALMIARDQLQLRDWQSESHAYIGLGMV
jgi:hypothetical protein